LGIVFKFLIHVYPCLGIIRLFFPFFPEKNWWGWVDIPSYWRHGTGKSIPKSCTFLVVR